jgi:hypothetical protein
MNKKQLNIQKYLNKTRYFGLYGTIILVIMVTILVSINFIGSNYSISYHIASHVWSIEFFKVVQTITMPLIATSFWWIRRKYNFKKTFSFFSLMIIFFSMLVAWIPKVSGSEKMHEISAWTFLLLMLVWTILVMYQGYHKLTRFDYICSMFYLFMSAVFLLIKCLFSVFYKSNFLFIGAFEIFYFFSLLQILNRKKSIVVS